MIRSIDLASYVAITGLLAALNAPGRADSPPFPEPKDVTQLWAGFDPNSPLQVEVQKEWTENGARFQKVYFTGEVWEGEPVRVFALTGVPADVKDVPGILHIHGGGQTASEPWIRFWTQRRYAVVSLDWLGKHADRTDYTRWGKAKANMMIDGQERTTKPSVRYSYFYHWALASRRALTLLEQLPGVDRNRLGIFGISVGGYLTWLVAGSDARVKTAVPIYGCGWNTYPDVHSGGGYAHPVPPEIDLWRATLEPETYARYIHCPMLLLSATNDFATPFDRCYDSLTRVGAETRQSFTPRYNHHLEAPQGHTLATWMDWQLKGGPAWAKTPQIRAEVRDGEIEAVVQPDTPADVIQVQIMYALGDKRPQTRFWRSAGPRRDGDTWRARLPLMDPAQILRAISNVTYARGYTLTSTLLAVTPTTLGPARATDQATSTIDDFAAGIDDWTFGPAYTDPYIDWSYLRAGAGPNGSAALTLNPVAWGDAPIKYVVGTHKVGDPKWAAPAGAALTFQFRGRQPATLAVHVLVDHWGPQAREYIAMIKLGGSSDWQPIAVKAEQCATKSGDKLKDFSAADRIDFVGQSPAKEPPSFAKVEWVKP